MREYGLLGFRHAVVTPGQDGPLPQADVTCEDLQSARDLEPLFEALQFAGGC